MDAAHLQRIIEAAERTPCEGAYAGLTLGQAMATCPEEVSSGRVASSRKRSDASRVAKAYVKFVAAAKELADALKSPGGAPVGAAAVGTKRTLPLRDPTAGILACMPVAPTKIRNADMTSKKEALQNSELDTTNSLHQRLGRFAKPVGSALWMKGIICAVVTFLLPKLAVRLFSLLCQILIQITARQAAEFVNIATAETTNLGNHVLQLVESSLEVSLGSASTAEPQTAAAPVAQIASSLATGLEAGNFSFAVDQLRAIATAQAAPAPAPPAASYRLPGWLMVIVGIVINKY